MARLIDWSVFESRWAEFFPSKTGRPASSPRLIAGLLYLQHTFACSDKDLPWTRVENQYWQDFCGETYFQHELPIEHSSMTRWRQHLGEEGVERLPTETIKAACRGKVVKAMSFEKIIIDITVMEKAVAYPTGSRLLERGRQHRVKLARTLAEHAEQIELFYLSIYGPELNFEERLNADLKQAMGSKVPVRTKAKLRSAVVQHMTEVEQSPERVKAFFKDKHVRHAT